MRDDRQLELFDLVRSQQTTHAATSTPVQPIAPATAGLILMFSAAKRLRKAAGGCAVFHRMSPVADIVTFPQDKRHAKVQSVATKLLARPTPRAVDHYRCQVTEAMEAHLSSRRIPASKHKEQIRRFWVAVDREVARRVNWPR